MAEFTTPLPACPFCDDAVAIIFDGFIGLWFGECACGATGPAAKTEVEATAAWSRRSPSPDVGEALRIISAFNDAVEDAMQNQTNKFGVAWVRGHSDVQLTPSGSVMLSDARTFIAEHSREPEGGAR